MFGWRLPSPAWNTLPTRRPCAADDLVHAAEHVRQLGARDHAVHHHVGGRHAAVGAERGLAALPQELALGLVARHAHLARAGLAARLGTTRSACASMPAASPSSSMSSAAAASRG